MAYGPSKTSLFQTASNSAATLTAAGITDVDAFRAIRDELYSDLLAIMETEVAEAPTPTPARSFGGGNYPKKNTGGEGGDYIVTFGKKHPGKTIRQIFSEDRSFVTNFLMKSRDPEAQQAAETFLKGIGAI